LRHPDIHASTAVTANRNVVRDANDGAVVIGLLAIGFVAGMIAGVSPCILPILPVVFVGWTDPIHDATHPFRARRRRDVTVVMGLVVSFALITALGSAVLSTLGLPQNLLRDVGLALLFLFGVGLLVPNLEKLLERPFARLSRSGPRAGGSAFLFGLGLGAVFVPCAGPVLAAITTLGARHHASFYSVLLSFFFAAGAAVPLLSIALAGDRLIERNRRLSQRARRLRPLGGVLLIVMAVALALNLTSGIQKLVPGYTNALQHHVEGNSFAFNELNRLSYSKAKDGSLTTCEQYAASGYSQGLSKCGAAPQFTGITKWLNTAGDEPLTLKSLRGHVVLVDFWTYSCINCQRTLPHVEAWYKRYHNDGFDVIGVQSPEFAFEHVIGNITAAVKSLGVKYPVAVDNNLATWTAYRNNYWPGEYLIDAQGVIRHVDYGEGNYGADEDLIRTLLTSANPDVALPPSTSVPDLTPTQAISPETYLGADRSQYLDGAEPVANENTLYHFPASIPLPSYALSGRWLTKNQQIVAEDRSQLTLNFTATDVYLVLNGRGTIRVSLNGAYLDTLKVSGYARLYTLLRQKSDADGLLNLQFSRGLEAYDFTFG
jgi:cytochrome c biogenesis protein CcdA/thiol-disulfide isomerase/thioredoxin